ncbi:hypothetical protein V6N12_020328 [Hibiscus sabdariffa]|uniref:RNase H type-1 domain-containing protein n=1 Tax=Hibiscus sabdariffa TaxID=183260 RepID=A0ABR2B1K0_9ROSI
MLNLHAKNVAGIGVGDDFRNTRFAVTCWLIWKSSCANIFGGVDFNSEGLARHSSVAAVEFAAAHACRMIPRRPLQLACLLLHDVREFLSRDWRVRIRYINRSGNMVADKLARMSRGKPIVKRYSKGPRERSFRYLRRI